MKRQTNSLERLLVPLTFLLVFFLSSRPPVDADMWWHLRAGQEMWAQGRILLNDIFSYTKQGAVWVNAFWLSEITLYWIHRIGGYFGLGFFVSFIGAATFLLVSRRMDGNPILRAFIVILAAVTAAPVWGPRPQIVSFLIVACLDLWLSRSTRHKWVLVPVFALWANLHGGWIWGFLLLLAHIAGLFVNSFFLAREESIKYRKEILALIGWTVLAGLAVGLNPNGISIWKLPFQQVNVSLQIQEWLSPDFHRADFHPMLWMLFLLILCAPFARKPLDAPQIFKTLGFAYLTFVAQRNIALFAIAAAPLLADWMDSALTSFIAGKSRLDQPPSLNPRLAAVINALILFVLAAAALGNLFLVTQPEKVDSNYPTAAVEWMKSNQPAGRLFNSYNWGGYLLWTLPEYPVFIDGRADMYGEEIIGQWHDAVNAKENALSILEEWQVDIVLVEQGWEITDLLKAEGWRVGFEDESSIILIHP